MSTSVVSTKGQVVIPAEVRADMKVEAGTRVEFVKSSAGWLIKPASLPVSTLKGMLPRKTRPVSIAEMNRAIRARAQKSVRPR